MLNQMNPTKSRNTTTNIDVKPLNNQCNSMPNQIKVNEKTKSMKTKKFNEASPSMWFNPQPCEQGK